MKKVLIYGLLISGLLYASNLNSNKKESLNLCGNQMQIDTNYHKDQFSNWKKTNIIQMFNTKLIEYSLNKNNKDIVEYCSFYVQTDNTLKPDNKKIVKIKKSIDTKWFVNIPDYLYSKDLKFVFGQIVLTNGKTLKAHNLKEFKKMINLNKNHIVFLKAVYKSKKATAIFIESFKKNSIFKFRTIIEVKDSSLNPIKNSPYDISIPKSYIDRTKNIRGINKMKFDHAEPAYNINIKGYTY